MNSFLLSITNYRKHMLIEPRIKLNIIITGWIKGYYEIDFIIKATFLNGLLLIIDFKYWWLAASMCSTRHNKYEFPPFNFHLNQYESNYSIV